jgi:hypothetical protein
MEEKNKIIELKNYVSMYINICEKIKNTDNEIKILANKQKNLDDKIKEFMTITDHQKIEAGNIEIEKINIKKSLPATKTFLKTRTLELCDGNVEQSDLVFSKLFDKELLSSEEVIKLKIKKINEL